MDACSSIPVFLYRFFLINPTRYVKKSLGEVSRLEKPEKPSAAELRELVDSLYRKYVKKLVERAQRCGCSPDYAEDVVQEVFRAATERAADLYASPNQIGWLMRTLRNKLGDNYRAMKCAQRLKAQMEKKAADAYEDQLSPQALYKGLVSDEELDLLIRFYVGGYPIRDIAANLNISYETCKKRIQRAKAHFYEAFKDQIENS